MLYDPADPNFLLPTWATLPPWCAAEKWELFERDGKVWARVTGRQLAPASLKRNPLWWFRNSFEEQTADWYQPEWPQWRRTLYWTLFRNPLQNYRCFVVGVADRNYEVEVVEGHLSPFVVQRNDVGQVGYQRTKLHFPNGATRDFWSYSTTNGGSYYHGWQATGIFGVKVAPGPLF